MLDASLLHNWVDDVKLAIASRRDLPAAAVLRSIAPNTYPEDPVDLDPRIRALYPENDQPILRDVRHLHLVTKKVLFGQ